MAIWSAVVANHDYGELGGNAIDDERKGYTWWTGTHHPDSSDAYFYGERRALPAIDAALSHDAHRFLSEGGLDLPMSHDLPGPLVFAVGRLGVGALVIPDDAIVADTLGLANPIGARITVTRPGRPGHVKILPWPWLLAEFEDPSGAPAEGATPEQIAAARHAMQCGDLAEMLASTHEPMSASRFWANLTGAFFAHAARDPGRPDRGRAPRSATPTDLAIVQVIAARRLQLRRDVPEPARSPRAGT